MVKQKNNLSEKAMLVSVSFSFWTGKTKDSRVTNEVIVTKKSARDAGTWLTNLVSKSDLGSVESARGKVRETHYKYSLPWMDGGLRILPSAMFMKYREEMSKAIAEHEKALAAFLREYPSIVKRAQKRLGDLLKDKHLPEVWEVKRKFAIRQDILPIPAMGDFRCELSSDEADEIREKVAASIESMTERAVANIWEQFTTLIEKIEKTMKEPKKVFRDTLISNLRDFCELIPKMNLTNDNKLESLRKEVIAKLAELKPINLRESKADRKKACKSAKEILTKMKGYGI
jgi:hypothetical protein